MSSTALRKRLLNESDLGDGYTRTPQQFVWRLGAAQGCSDLQRSDVLSGCSEIKRLLLVGVALGAH